MRGHCIICAELFTASSEISAVSCGHTFHYLCLTQWTQRSKTCPQCRIKLTTKSVIQKLYFDAGPDLEPDEDPDALRNKNNQLETELREKCRAVAAAAQTAEALVKQTEKLEMDISNTKVMLNIEKDLNSSLKIQLECLSGENKRTKRLEKETATLTTKLKEYKNIQVILNGSEDDAKKILESHGGGFANADQLAKLCGYLKSELSNTGMQKNRLATKVKRLELDKAKLEKEVRKQHDSEDTIAGMASEIAQRDKRIQFLEEQLKKAETNKLTESSLDPKKVKNPTWLFLPHAASFPDVSTLVFDKENDSPILTRCSLAARIATAQDKKPANTRIVQKSSGQLDAEAYKHFYIMNRTKSAVLKGKSAPATGFSGLKELGYDGMGGHSKAEIFPTGASKTKRKVKLAAGPKATKISRTNGPNSSADATIIIE